MDERFVTVGGVRTRYLESGRGEPMLLIHGGDFGGYELADDWAPVIGRLGQSFHVMAIDKIGCGFTGNPEGAAAYVIGSVVRHALNFLHTVGAGPAHVVGHSRGGYAAARLALEAPDAVRTLTIVDSGSLMAPPNPIYRRWNREAGALADPRVRVRYLIAVNSFSDAHIDSGYVEAMSRAVELPKSKHAAAILARGWPAFENDLVQHQEQTRSWISAGRLQRPTLVVWGYDDPSATMDRAGIPCMQLILGHVPVSEMHILGGAGHFCFRERPAEFVAVISDFLRRSYRTRPPAARAADLLRASRAGDTSR